jgi:hypothetical protein
MGSNNPGLAKNYATGAAVAGRRVVKFSADLTVVQAAAATDLSIGVSDRLGAASGERCDVYREGIVEVDAGGTVTRGKKVTSDADGKVVDAAPGAGANVQIIGVAEISGVSGDIVAILLAPSVMQG